MEELESAEIERYNRQILLNELSIEGQLKLKSSKVLVIGAGGLGSPILLYLGGAGIGTIGIVDGDSVEIINLHRQIIHSSNSPKLNKAESAKQAILSLNPLVKVEIYPERLTAKNSRDIVPKYDVLVIATDNVESRYLISDLGVYYEKPVVSGSCVRWDGQLSVYVKSQCYRCAFPVPTPRRAITRASDVGVLGPIPGVIGTLQAVETIKVILGLPTLIGKMLMYDGIACKFRCCNIRGNNEHCPACLGIINPHEYDYIGFMGNPDEVVPTAKKITIEEFGILIKKDIELIDLRPKNQFAIVHINGAKNIPAYTIGDFDPNQSTKPLVFVDKNGIEASKIVEGLSLKGVECCYLSGGLEAWKVKNPDFNLF